MAFCVEELIMKAYFVLTLCSLLLLLSSVQAQVLFWDDFEDGVMSDKWKIIAEVYTEENGVLSMTQGAEQYPNIVVDELFDFSNGVTFQADLRLGQTNDMVMPISPTDSSELPRKIPWDGPFVRICIDKGVGVPILQSTPVGNGQDVSRLVDFDPIDWEQEYQWAMYVTEDRVKVYLDGDLVADEEHTGGFSQGYLTFGGSQAVDTTIDNVVIYTGDYDKNIIDKAKAVRSAGKLFIGWGAIKDQYR
jgi:hypothetical protein